MDTVELAYELPERAIAQTPAEPRDSARLLVAGGAGDEVQHRTVADLPDLLRAGDLLVVNDTRVIPARLHLRKDTGGAVEVLLLERRPEGHWEALVKPSRRVADGSLLRSPDHPEVQVEVGPVLGDDGRRMVTVHGGADDLAVLDLAGEVPLPPYIHEPLADPERYQTVFAHEPGSVAAPTAGLHLTDARVPTGMNSGVGRTPRAVVTLPVRARPSVASTSMCSFTGHLRSGGPAAWHRRTTRTGSPQPAPSGTGPSSGAR